MRVMLSGAGGFCGQHLLGYLQNQGVEVHTIGPRPRSCHHQIVDPLNLESLKQSVQLIQPELVFHLAGVASGTDAMLYYRINTQFAAGLLQALEMAGRSACPVLLVGSAAEYGLITNDDLPVAETTPAKPYNFYGLSKLAQTELGVALSRAGRPVVMTRPFNIIGPGMPEHLALQSFVRQLHSISRGESSPVIEVGNLSSYRDFIGVAEVVSFYWELLQNPAAYGQIINICSGKPLQMSFLLDRLISLCKLDVEIRSDPARLKPVDVPVHYGSPVKLQKMLGLPDTFLPDIDETLKPILKSFNLNTSTT